MKAPRRRVINWEFNTAGYKLYLECGHTTYHERKVSRVACHKCWKKLDYDSWYAETCKDSIATDYSIPIPEQFRKKKV